jgi:hypothetical protein
LLDKVTFYNIEGEQCLVTQVEANRHFEKYDFELHSKFGKIIQIVSNAVFYAAIFPLGLIFTICGLLLTYWSSKAFLVQFCSIPKQSYRLGRLAVMIDLMLERYHCIFPDYFGVRVRI